MSKITLDSDLKAKLNGGGAPVELCDEAGHTVGYFVSAEWYREMLVAWAKDQVSEEELERARKQTGGRTWKEIRADLEKRCPTP
jgi:hypothetical protein